MENTFERTVRYLQDLHAAEKACEDLLWGLSKRTDGDIDFRELAEKGVVMSRARTVLLSKRIADLGGQTSNIKDWMNTVVGQMGDIRTIGHDNVDKNTMDLVKAYASCQSLLGIYTALASFASASNDQTTRTLAEDGRERCREFALDILPHIESTAKLAAGPQFSI